MTQDAASRAAETLETEMLVDKHCRDEVSAIIRAEYAELVAVSKEISRRLADPELSVTMIEEDRLNKALKAVEGV